jgi:hypothetical protein
MFADTSPVKAPTACSLTDCASPGHSGTQKQRLHLTEVGIRRANRDVTRQPACALLDALKQHSILLEAAMHFPVAGNELSTHELDNSVGEKLSDYNEQGILRSI